MCNSPQLNSDTSPSAAPAASSSEGQTIAQLQARIKAQDEFIATLAHEIRNPLNSIIGISSMLKESVDPSILDRMIQHLNQSAELLHAIVNDLLEMSKLTSGVVPVRMATVSLESLGGNIISAFIGTAMAKGLSIHFEHIPELLPMILTDPALLRRVLVNLVSNAVKFTQKGGVTLSLQVRGLPSRKYEVIFEVEDTGPGIPDFEVDHLFKPFYQGSACHLTGQRGTGLGLSLCCSIVNHMGGSLDFVTRPDQGTTFRLRLECPAALETVPESPMPPQGHVFNVLLFEESFERRAHSMDIFKHPQIALDVAGNSTDLLRLVASKAYDYILMSTRLRSVSSSDLAAQVLESAKGLPKIIGLGVDISSEIYDRCLKSGVSSFLELPLMRRELCQALALESNNEISPISLYRCIDPHRVGEMLAWDQLSQAYHGAALADIFLKTIPSTLRSLQRAADLNEWAFLSRVTASLRHSFRSVGATKLLQIHAALQDAINERDKKNIRNLLSRMRLEHRRASRELSNFLSSHRRQYQRSS
ncbi:MAG: hypothetical protein JW739_02775 [Opitutales bacterium]|nr:hypothetical protein [Opitutales bacterium]